MLGRTALCGARPRACLFGVAPDGGCRVSPCSDSPRPGRANGTEWPCRSGARAPPSLQTRLCGPIPRLRAAHSRARRSPDGC